MPKSLGYVDIAQASMSQGMTLDLDTRPPLVPPSKRKPVCATWILHSVISADFKQHITAKVTLKNRVSWILRTFRTRDLLPMLTLWKQLALCEHDYCCLIWSSSRAGEVQALEAVQRAFVKNI